MIAVAVRTLLLGATFGTLTGVAAWALLTGIAHLIPHDDPDPWGGREGEE